MNLRLTSLLLFPIIFVVLDSCDSPKSATPTEVITDKSNQNETDSPTTKKTTHRESRRAYSRRNQHIPVVYTRKKLASLIKHPQTIPILDHCRRMPIWYPYTLCDNKRKRLFSHCALVQWIHEIQHTELLAWLLRCRRRSDWRRESWDLRKTASISLFKFNMMKPVFLLSSQTYSQLRMFSWRQTMQTCTLGLKTMSRVNSLAFYKSLLFIQ